MPTIHKLHASVVNKIAAGEVIERPASVVKELMENALDAGARRIDVSVEQGGGELVRVVDDGCGIPPEELPLAVTCHATSKLETADDLFRVRTLGFRGEALASIAEVSRLWLRSRVANSPAGAELEVNAGTMSEVSPCGGPPGTTLEVRHLFFNTPVRRKFLRSTQTEMGHVTEAFTRLALAHPAVHFTLKHNGRPVHDLPPVGELRERVSAFFGAELAQALLWIESQDEGIRLAGYVAHPSQTRANPRMQYLFLNGRHIRDRSLQHALGEAYRGLILTNRYPISFLSFEMPPDQVDVNVHPTKLEVRFQDGARLYSQLLGTLRTRFLTTDLTHQLDARGSTSTLGSTFGGAAATTHTAHDPAHAQGMRQSLVDWAKGQLPADSPAATTRGTAHTPWPHEPASLEPALHGAAMLETGSSAAQTAVAEADLSDPPAWSAQILSRAPLPMFELDSPRTSPDGSRFPHDPRSSSPPARTAFAPNASTVGTGDARGSMVAAFAPTADNPRGFSPGAEPDRMRAYTERRAVPPPALQVHNRYLIAESDDGLLVIDQHALHERILYEQLRESILSNAVEIQRLLVPEPVNLTGAEAALVLNEREVLAELGVQIEPFGGSTVLVSSLPALLNTCRPAEVLAGLIDQLLDANRPPQRRDLVDHLLHSVACKAAVKAGDRLAAEEIEALMEQRHLVQDTHHCPHGRPTALVFTREELDKQFKRT